MIRTEWADVRTEEETTAISSLGFFFAVAELRESGGNAASARPDSALRKPSSPRRARVTRSSQDTADTDIDPDATRLLRHAAPLRSAL